MNTKNHFFEFIDFVSDTHPESKICNALLDLYNGCRDDLKSLGVDIGDILNFHFNKRDFFSSVGGVEKLSFTLENTDQPYAVISYSEREEDILKIKKCAGALIHRDSLASNYLKHLNSGENIRNSKNIVFLFLTTYVFGTVNRAISFDDAIYKTTNKASDTFCIGNISEDNDNCLIYLIEDVKNKCVWSILINKNVSEIF